MSWWLLLACVEPSPDVEVDSGAPMPRFDNPTAAPTWTPEQAAAELQAALDLGLPEPWGFRQHYRDLLDLGDPECPGTEEYITDTHLLGCTAESGTWYAGITEYHDAVVERDGVVAHSRILIGDIEIVDPEGREFGLGGHVAENASVDEATGSIYYNELKGTMLYEGGEDWFVEPVSGLLGVSLKLLNDGAPTLLIDGSVQYFGRSLDFREFSATRAEACGLALAGEVSIRDPGGAWHTLRLTEDCGACGPLSFPGVAEAAEVCVDVEPVLQRVAAQAERMP